MATMIAEASSDENNSARGGIAGDQKQRAGNAKEEVGTKNWYNRTGGWGVCLECTDEQLGSDAADIATRIANDDSFGYDQDQRSTIIRKRITVKSDGTTRRSPSAPRKMGA